MVEAAAGGLFFETGADTLHNPAMFAEELPGIILLLETPFDGFDTPFSLEYNPEGPAGGLSISLVLPLFRYL